MTYVPKTNKLKLIGTGSGGLAELQDELSEGKVQVRARRRRRTARACAPTSRARARQYFLIDYKDGAQQKLVYVCFVGDAVPTVIKGTVNKHADEVGNWFGTVAAQVNARTEGACATRATLGVGAADRSSRQPRSPRMRSTRSWCDSAPLAASFRSLSARRSQSKGRATGYGPAE